MGKFANGPADTAMIKRISAEEMGEDWNENDEASLEVGTCLGPVAMREPWSGQSGFEAMGHAVPAFRKTAGEAALKAMGFNRPDDSERRYDIVARMAVSIERDNSHEALEEALKAGLDVTGCYRLLSVLLCEDRPGQEPAAPSYVDLVTA